MATVSASTSTAIDVQSLVSQLMAIERQPITKLNTKISNYQSKISSLGTVQGLVSSFQSAATSLGSSLQGYGATSSDSTVLTGIASTSATAGIYSVTVGPLAQAQSLAATGQASTSTTISSGASTTISFDFGTTVGATFTSNGSGVKTVTIDATNNTLQGISDAINAAKIGVTASIVNDGSATPYRLVLTSSNSGASNSLKITTNGAGNGVDTLLAYDPAGTKNMTQTVAAQDASFTMNGLAMTSASNTVTNAIPGVTLTLSKENATANLTVARDVAAISTAASNFVSAYNALYSQLKSRTAYGSSTTTAGTLAGDITVRGMMDQLRNILMTPATGGTMSNLLEVGITTQASDGSLKLDSAKLSTAISNDYTGVVNLFTSTTGFATRLNSWATSTLTAGGTISSRITSFNSNITDLNKQVSALENRMTQLQKLYTNQYTRLNMALSSMNSTSAYLSQQLTK